MSNSNNGEHEKHEHHITPISVYIRVWVGLIVLTVVTVGSSYIDFGGSNNILIAMVIATVKAVLVVLFFMGLKYDGLENNVTFFSTILFLAIFVALTWSDIFYRFDTQPVRVDSSENPVAEAPVDLKTVVAPTPALVDKGKMLFSQQCMACHGAEGKGDGPAAAALNPKPRNFHITEGWKNGRQLAQVFKTLTNGIPGTPMASFSAMSVEDRMALAHYVRSMGPEAPQDSAADLAMLQSMVGSSAVKKPRLPIDFTIDRMAE